MSDTMPRAAESGRVWIEWAAQAFLLLPEAGLYWPALNSLLVADPHFGKATHFRRSGVPVPGGTTNKNLTRLDAMIEATGAARLIVLGDLFHARDGLSNAMIEQLAAWRKQQASLRIDVVRGNHDQHAGPPPASLQMESVGDELVERGVVLRHEPSVDGGGRPVLAGHVHPAVRLHGVAMRSARLPCFHFTNALGVLPAFGAFTGMHPIRPREGDGIYAIGPEGVFAV